jgi:hypothetical protein
MWLLRRRRQRRVVIPLSDTGNRRLAARRAESPTSTPALSATPVISIAVVVIAAVVFPLPATVVVVAFRQAIVFTQKVLSGSGLQLGWQLPPLLALLVNQTVLFIAQTATDAIADTIQVL